MCVRVHPEPHHVQLGSWWVCSGFYFKPEADRNARRAFDKPSFNQELNLKPSCSIFLYYLLFLTFGEWKSSTYHGCVLNCTLRFAEIDTSILKMCHWSQLEMMDNPERDLWDLLVGVMNVSEGVFLNPVYTEYTLCERTCFKGMESSSG